MNKKISRENMVKNRYKNTSEENKQRLKEYQKIIVELKNQNSFQDVNVMMINGHSFLIIVSYVLV